MEVPSGGTVTLRQGLYNGKDMKQELEGKTLHIELVFVCFFFFGKGCLHINIYEYVFCMISAVPAEIDGSYCTKPFPHE